MLENDVIEDVLYAALSRGGDFAEIFVEDRASKTIEMLAGRVEKSISGRDYGVGIRIFDGLNSIYAYSNDSAKDNLIELAKSAAAALDGKQVEKKIKLMRREIEKNNNPIDTRLTDVAMKDKVDLLKRGDEAAKAFDQSISQVTARYLEEEQKILIANTDGLIAEDERIRTRYAIQSVASQDGEMQVGFFAPGKSMGFEFYDEIDVEEVAREASRIAVTSLNADYAPSGKMPVIIHKDFGGVLFHEACGHALEAESVSRDASAFAGKEGKKVASSLVTAVDDGTIPNAWGTTNIDDEGTPTRKNILIEDGILKSYLVDRLNGKRMNRKTTGSSRRQSYRYPPTSRMNNTYIAPGESKLDDMIAGTEYGLFAKKLGGGSVNPATGDFNFAVMEAYMIEDGKMGRPVRGATLIGNGVEVLEKIDMVGDNLGLGQGMCGASSGSLAVNVGQPSIRVSSLTLGGRKKED